MQKANALLAQSIAPEKAAMAVFLFNIVTPPDKNPPEY
jgi:hypothetical protein